MDCTRRQFLEATPLAVCAALSASSAKAEASLEPPTIGRSARPVSKPVAPAVLDLGSRVSLRVLQITDNHFFGRAQAREKTPLDENTVKDWQAHVARQKPDLIMATGDLWHDDPEGRGMFACDYAIGELERLGVPWAFCWGNHDDLADPQLGHDRIAGARGSLYRGASAHGDYRVEVRGGGSVAHLFCMNTDRSGLGPWQLRWLGTELATTKGPGLGFFHIPVLEQKTLFTPGQTPGVQGEAVCHEAENGAAVPVLARDGRLRACFCGHDHVNDYTVISRGLSLVYGRATGYSGYGGDKVRKGAKLIELDVAKGDWRQVTVFADGTEWKPS